MCVSADVTVGFDPELYRVNEADGSATLTVRLLNGILEREVTVLFETSPGTATETGTDLTSWEGEREGEREIFFKSSFSTFIFAEPADYTPVTQVLTFSPTISANNVTVLITNDDILEDTEAFFGNLNNQGQPVITDPERAIVEIVEDASDC